MKYPAKLLLFGEHTVNLGSQALAIPLWRFGGELRFLSKEKMPERAVLQMDLPQFAAHLFRLRQNGDLPAGFDAEKFQTDLSNGLVFESDIPTGYGAGSSGALVAAIYSRYSSAVRVESGQADLPELKKTFAKMESYFHGTSSGTDPLVCYLQQPVLLSKTAIELATPSQLSPPHYHFFLLDTGIPRQATPFIEYFLEQNSSDKFRDKCQGDLLPAVDAGIESYLTGDGKKLMEAVHRIGAFQLKWLEKMIPPAYCRVWQEGMSGDLFKLKVCGAGGGGFILGITQDFEKLKVIYPDLKFLEL